MSKSKKLTISLNSKERMLLNDVCTVVGVADRSKVAQSLMVTKAHEFLKQVTEERMKQREAAAAKASEEEVSDEGKVDGDSEQARDSSAVDSSVLAEQKDSVADAGGSESASK